MFNINPLLLIDFYKATHDKQLPKGMTKSVSYFTPRMSRVKRWDKVVFFGLQSFIKTYLIDYFNKNFFGRSKDEVVNEYKHYMELTLGPGIANYDKIGALHDLGYLPIEILALPEGTMCPIKVPCLSITNTHDDFCWLPQALESLMSAELWYPMVCATVGKTYRDIVNKYYDLTVDDSILRSRALSNFDFRGDKGLDAALKAGSGWCTSFALSATVPIVPYLEKMYPSDCSKEDIAYGGISTEHFVMCSNYAVDGDEKSFIKRLITEVYPKGNVSCVMDSYDYWNVIDNILPSLKDDILGRDGTLLCRGDSGDPIDVVTTTVFKLWDTFGGTINNKGYKVLDHHVKAIYGDSITVERCEAIYKILMDNGFACNNVALGVGSFSFQCIEEDGVLKPFTRDTFGMALKACDAVIDGVEYPIFKDPKTDREAGGESFKKSQKGCILVENTGDTLVATDGLKYADTLVAHNMLKPVFLNGSLMRTYSLKEVRANLNNNNF